MSPSKKEGLHHLWVSCLRRRNAMAWGVFLGVGVVHKVLDETPSMFVVDLFQVDLGEMILDPLILQNTFASGNLIS